MSISVRLGRAVGPARNHSFRSFGSSAFSALNHLALHVMVPLFTFRLRLYFIIYYYLLILLIVILVLTLPRIVTPVFCGCRVIQRSQTLSENREDPL